MAVVSTELHREAGGKFTYADYLTWPESERWEVIEGVVFDMSPAPGTEHQAVSFRLGGILYSFLKGKECQAFAAPFDVRLTEHLDAPDERIETVVQPDIVVVCDRAKLDKRGCLGPPDIAVEILSPATSYKDQTEKLFLYEKHLINEYWIVNPDGRYVMVYRFKENRYGKPDYLMQDDILESGVLPGLKIHLREIWA